MSSASDQRSTRLGTLVAAVLGLGLAAWMFRSYGAGKIIELLIRAGWLGIPLIVLFHLTQMLASALGWQSIAAPLESPPRQRTYLLFRWIREAVNNLLPLAQIGGEFVAARLLQRRGEPLAPAVAGLIADLSLEIATQLLFTMLGLALLAQIAGTSELAAWVAKVLLLAALLLGGTIAAFRLGLAATLEKALTGLGRSLLGWPVSARIAGLKAALLACYRARARVLRGATWHLVSWLLGGLEVCLILHFFGADIGIGPGLAIESLGQASKALGFAVPGAIGVQEGGYLAVCSVLGLQPEMGIALSLMKRVREVVWGVPGLILWQRAEAKPPVPTAAMTGGTP
jgi:putative membrane protein